MTHRYIVAASHGSTLASGRPVAPGDKLPASAVDLDDPHDQHLLEDGFLVDLEPTKPKASKPTEASK